MRSYVIRRLLLLVPTVFIVSLLIFIMIRLIPGSIIDIMVTRMYSISEQTYAEIAHNLGLDVPIYTQFGRWWGVLPQPDGVGFSAAQVTNFAMGRSKFGELVPAPSSAALGHVDTLLMCGMRLADVVAGGCLVNLLKNALARATRLVG